MSKSFPDTCTRRKRSCAKENNGGEYRPENIGDTAVNTWRERVCKTADKHDAHAEGPAIPMLRPTALLAEVEDYCMARCLITRHFLE